MGIFVQSHLVDWHFSTYKIAFGDRALLAMASGARGRRGRCARPTALRQFLLHPNTQWSSWGKKRKFGIFL